VALGFCAAAAGVAAQLAGCAAVMLAGAVAVGVTCGYVTDGAARDRCRLPYRAFMWTQHTCHLMLLCTLGLAALLA
jgi:hypothetical protein